MADSLTTPGTLPTPDYAALRAEGMALLAQVAAQLADAEQPGWTDFNAHDPGITILEAVCYALTDLGYRIDYPIADLLASGSATAGDTFFPPDAILTTAPVTARDWRKLAADAAGIHNAWQQPAEVTLHYDAVNRKLSTQPLPLHDRPVTLRGLHAFQLDIPNDAAAEGIEGAVWQRLHAVRALGEDITGVERLPPQDVIVEAQLEIAPGSNPQAILQTVLRRLSDHIEPRVRFDSLAQRQAAGQAPDAMFNGPRLVQGLIDNAEFDVSQRRATLRTSDLIQLLMDVPGVTAVYRIDIGARYASADRIAGLGAGEETVFDDAPQAGDTPLFHRAQWYLKLDPACAPRLKVRPDVQPDGSADPYVTRIGLHRRGLPLDFDERGLIDELERWRRTPQERRAPQPPADTQPPPPPPGRDRNIAQYEALRQHFPALYGIGQAGLPATADAVRQAQATQLKAYLRLFDQLLANQFAQLAHVGDLLAAEPLNPATYVARPVDDPDPTLPFALVHFADGELQALRETDGTARRLRFLEHLLARFGERPLDDAIPYDLRGSSGNRHALIAAKQRHLLTYAESSYRRGCGPDVLEGGRSGLEQRLRERLLIADDADAPQLVVIEHILLRPIAEDDVQAQPTPSDERRLPLLRDASADPFSLQLTIACDERWMANEADRHFFLRVARAATPAHLALTVRWLPEANMATLHGAHGRLHAALAAYRAGHDPAAHFQLRAARDQMIDLLYVKGGLGQTCPIRDLPLPPQTHLVPYGTPGQIVIPYSQPDVRYVVHPTVDGRPGDAVVTHALGNGGDLVLTTPAVTGDVSYFVHAVKVHHADATGGDRMRDVYLNGQPITLLVGPNTTLATEILDQQWLDPAQVDPPPTAARLCDYGTPVRVRLYASEPEIHYALTDADGNLLSEEVLIGNGDNLTFAPITATRDVDIRIVAGRPGWLDEPVQLNAVLPLRVRANRAVAVTQPDGAVIAYGGPATLQIASEAECLYQPFVRTLPDDEIRRYAVDDAAWLTVVVPDQWLPDNASAQGDGPLDPGTVAVRRPPQAHPWSLPDGFAPFGAPVAGTGEPLEIVLDGLTEDSAVIVRAVKQHRRTAAPAADTIESAVQLTTALAILTAPNVAQPLAWDGRTLRNGQPGVLYYIADAETGALVGRPLYVHKRQDGLNKGISGEAVAIDFVIAAFDADTADSATATPRLDLGADVPTRPIILAVKALTGVHTVIE